MATGNASAYTPSPPPNHDLRFGGSGHSYIMVGGNLKYYTPDSVQESLPILRVPVEDVPAVAELLKEEK